MKLLNYIFAYVVIILICSIIGHAVYDKTGFISAVFVSGYIASSLLESYKKNNK